MKERTIAGVIFLVVDRGWNLGDTSGRNGLRREDGQFHHCNRKKRQRLWLCMHIVW